MIKTVSLKLCKTKECFRNAYNVYCQSFNLKVIPFEEFYERYGNDKIFLIKNKNQILGFVMLTSRNEIGYYVLPEYQRSGIAKLAVKKLIAIEKRKYYWAMINMKNDVSMRFIQSLNFIPSGIVYSQDREKI